MTLPGKGGWAGNTSSGLNSGLLLEDRHILLPWGARLLQLMLECAPSQQISTLGWDELTWTHPLVFHGLRAQLLQVIIYPYGWFDSACIWLYQGEHRLTARRAYQYAHAHLRRLFGPAEIPGPAACSCDDVHELLLWQQPHWGLSLFVRSGSEFEPFKYATILHCHKHIP